jgi:hypothetical protein
VIGLGERFSLTFLRLWIMRDRDLRSGVGLGLEVGLGEMRWEDGGLIGLDWIGLDWEKDRRIEG